MSAMLISASTLFSPAVFADTKRSTKWAMTRYTEEEKNTKQYFLNFQPIQRLLMAKCDEVHAVYSENIT